VVSLYKTALEGGLPPGVLASLDENYGLTHYGSQVEGLKMYLSQVRGYLQGKGPACGLFAEKLGRERDLPADTEAEDSQIEALGDNPCLQCQQARLCACVIARSQLFSNVLSFSTFVCKSRDLRSSKRTSVF
jgi:hypothetical protein